MLAVVPASMAANSYNLLLFSSLDLSSLFFYNAINFSFSSSFATSATIAAAAAAATTTTASTLQPPLPSTFPSPVCLYTFALSLAFLAEDTSCIRAAPRSSPLVRFRFLVIVITFLPFPTHPQLAYPPGFIDISLRRAELTCERPRYIETVSDMYRNLPSAATAIAKPSRDCSDRKYEVLEERRHRIFPEE